MHYSNVSIRLRQDCLLDVYNRTPLLAIPKLYVQLCFVLVFWYYDTSEWFPIDHSTCAILANFHFYQLIGDKTGKDLHQSALDVFVGVSLGTGVGVIFYDNSLLNDQVTPLAFGGAHVGARWYFAENMGLSGQFGFGKSLVDIGLVFKLP